MSTFSLTTTVTLGASKAGLTDLRAQLYDSAGVATGAPVSAGFTALGGGCYLWTFNGFTQGFRGCVAFYSNASGVVLATAPVNPLVLADGSISDDTFALDTDPSVKPSGIVSEIHWMASRMGVRTVRRDADHIRVKRADGTTDWTAQPYAAGDTLEQVEAIP